MVDELKKTNDEEKRVNKKPLSGLFSVNKPIGITSMYLIESLKNLFLTSKLFVENPPSQFPKTRKEKTSWKKIKHSASIKIGQGGTLDPLASGVLIIALNSATKKLSEFLNCSKTYRTTGILGCETDSYDCDGKIVSFAKWDHVTPEDVQKQCQSMKGEHWQTPPIYSALKMNGKPLYEYARNKIPLPKPIASRKCEIFDIKMTEWKEAGCHPYKQPKEKMSEQDVKILKQVENCINETEINKSIDSKEETQEPQSNKDQEQLNKSIGKRSSSSDNQEPELKKKKLNQDPTDVNLSETELPVAQEMIEKQNDESTLEENKKFPAFTLEMTVSSGTYVRKIVHDIGQAVSSAATVASLIRTRQGNFYLEGQYASDNSINKNESETLIDSEDKFKSIDWSVFEKAIQDHQNGIDQPLNESGLREWEEQLLKHLQI